MHQLLDRIADRHDLDRDEAERLFGAMIDGELTPVQIAALLIGLRMKGEKPQEIAGAAKAVRDRATGFPAPEGPFMDVCGTGGDGAGSLNISTVAAIVLAEMGIPVVKHGNRSVSSKCGSADLLEAFGVRLDPESSTARNCLDRVGICFLFAPQYHQGLRHAMPVRAALKMRTIFNILGPLVNPARPPFQLLGVYDPALVETMGLTLSSLGVRRSLVVHGGGMDEISVSGPTSAMLTEDGLVRRLEILPEDAGLRRFPLHSLAGGDAAQNRRTVEALLSGHGEAAHEASVAINAGAAAWVASAAKDIGEGTQAALEAMRSGRCLARLSAWVKLSHEEPQKAGPSHGA